MSLEALDLDCPLAKLADWFELSALIAVNSECSIGELKGMLLDSVSDIPQETDADIGDVEFDAMPSKDFQEDDDAVDNLIAAVQNEISTRAADLDGAYPFSLSQEGNSLSLKGTMTFGNYVYLYCLIISHSNKEGVFDPSIKPKLKNADRDVFQICATIAAAGYISGPSISFGFPRPDGSTAHKKLIETHKHFKSHAVEIRPILRKGTQPKLKDDGVDVICWETARGKDVALNYGLGQAATGLDWMDKSITTEMKSFLNTWYAVHPLETRPLMLIPFDPASNISGDEDTVLMEIRKQNDRLGRIIDRALLPRYAQEATAFDKSVVKPIERIDEQKKVKAWVDKFVAKAKKVK